MTVSFTDLNQSKRGRDWARMAEVMVRWYICFATCGGENRGSAASADEVNI